MRKLRTKPNNELRIKTNTLIDGQKDRHKIENYLFFYIVLLWTVFNMFFLFYMVFIIIFLIFISFYNWNLDNWIVCFIHQNYKKLVCKFWLFNLNTKKKLTNKILISLSSSAELYLIDIRNRIFLLLKLLLRGIKILYIFFESILVEQSVFEILNVLFSDFFPLLYYYYYRLMNII